MNKIKKNNTLRIITQAISFAFHNGYINGWMKGKIYAGDNKAVCVPGLNCYSCPGAVGACPIGSLQAVLDGGQFRISCYVLGFIGLVGMLLGRFICGWICPFGFIQDLMNKIPFPKKVKNLPGHKYLKYLRYVVLAVFVIILPMAIKNAAGIGQPWFCEYICPSGTLLGGIPLTLSNASLSGQIGARFIWKVVLLVIFLFGAVVAVRPFCKYICPLGAMYGLCNPVSVFRLNVNKDKCVECGACQKACGMDIKVWQKPNSTECIRCLKCRAACPQGAITTSLEDLRKKLTIDETSAENTESAAEVKASDVSDESVKEAPAAAEVKTAEDTAEVKSRGKRKAWWRYVLGVFNIIFSLIPIIFFVLEMILWYAGANTDGIFYFFLYIGFTLTVALVAVMQLIFGIKLIRDAKKPEKDAEHTQGAWINFIAVIAVMLINLVIRWFGYNFGGWSHYLYEFFLAGFTDTTRLIVYGSIIFSTLITAVIMQIAKKKAKK